MKKKNNNNSATSIHSPKSLPEPQVPKVPEKVAEKFYPNLDICKKKIFLENKNKSGIYRLKNLINDKKYVGSSLDLSKRLLFYYTPSKMNYALQQSKSFICSAIIKYGLNNFSLEILEYCESDKLLIREKYYIDRGAEYNIIKDPTLPPMTGNTHSSKTKTKISDALLGNTNCKNHPNSQVIEVTDITNNITTSYDSIHKAAKALNISNFQAIANYIQRNQKKPYKGQYTFKKL